MKLLTLIQKVIGESRLPFWIRKRVDRRTRTETCAYCRNITACKMQEPWQCSWCGKVTYLLVGEQK